ncbi:MULTISPECIES: hypothetical protein [Bradyrhizobium]|uniref:Uncharacterized protein n=2 Tax=Bradyrhizobium TaxID=374 RepID=A0ABY0QFB8_9BRAD|nr:MULTISPECIES: hypothetical protein [Bradyrhizobium]SDK14741.1 hypothetical protein SAMN05444163_7358 [Bradyrhizobium ottawaense]SEE50580.1 hypothetical protein SAMN05444171_7773 [Bradyrhizobium lablabi]
MKFDSSAKAEQALTEQGFNKPSVPESFDWMNTEDRKIATIHPTYDTASNRWKYRIQYRPMVVGV